MSHKKTLDEFRPSANPANANGSPTKAVVGNAAHVVHDITELAELQVQLFAADVGSVKRRVMVPILLLVLAGLMLFALLPVALLGVAEAFVIYAELSQMLSYFAAAGCGLAVVLLAAAIGFWGLRSGFRELDNSRQELRRNIEWIKTTLKRGGQ